MRYLPLFVIGLLLPTVGCNAKREIAVHPGKTAGPDEVAKGVRTVLWELYKLNSTTISMEQPITDPPIKADDLDLVEIIMELEERFDVVIPDELVERVGGVTFGKNMPRVTPNQLVKIVLEAQRMGKPDLKK